MYGFKPLSKVLAQWETQIALCRIWIWYADSFYYDDNRYAKSTLPCYEVSYLLLVMQSETTLSLFDNVKSVTDLGVAAWQTDDLKLAKYRSLSKRFFFFSFILQLSGPRLISVLFLFQKLVTLLPILLLTVFFSLPLTTTTTPIHYSSFFFTDHYFYFLHFFYVVGHKFFFVNFFTSAIASSFLLESEWYPIYSSLLNYYKL